jgi:hypothetical protein
MLRRRPSQIRSLLLLATLGLAGCGPYLEPYRYIRLDESPGLQALAKSQPTLAGLHFAGPMIARYRLERAGYVIDIVVPEQSYLPALEIRARTPGVVLKPLPEVPAAAAFCGAWYPVPDDPGRIDFGWSPHCEDGRPAEIVFEVRGSRGESLGIERLAFRLEANGWLLLVDAV